MLLLMLCVACTVANPITQAQALQKAKAFLQKKGMATTANLNLVYQGKQLSPQHGAPAKDPCYYVFNNGHNAGFIIMAGDDCAEEVLGYADSGIFNPNDIPNNMEAFLKGYVEEITAARAKNLSANDSEIEVEMTRKVVAPLIQTHWNQSDPYNQQCPTIGDELCVTGCVATALAQVMYYHKWPQGQTTAIPSYDNGKYPELDAITFDWDKMKPVYINTGEDDEVAEAAVAKLMHYCGQAVQMDYGVDASGASPYYIPIALKNYFGYPGNPTHIYRSSYTTKEWDEIIYHELKYGRPVLYGADAYGVNGRSGHEFICDGYDGHGLYHINWGWGGQSDGYFRLQALNPASQGIGGSDGDGGFSLGHDAVIGVSATEISNEEPIPSFNHSFAYQSLEVTSVEQRFDQGTDATQIRVYLKNTSTSDYSGSIHLLISGTWKGQEGVYITGNGEDYVDFYFAPMYGTVKLVVAYNQSGSSVIKTINNFTLSANASSSPNLVFSDSYFKNITKDNWNSKMYGSMLDGTIECENLSNEVYEGNLILTVMVFSEEDDEGYSYYNTRTESIPISIKAKEKKTIAINFTGLSVGDQFLFSLTAPTGNEIASYSDYTNWFIEVLPAIVTWKGNGERTVEVPTTNFTVEEDVCAVSLEDLGNNLSSYNITLNNNSNTIYYVTGSATGFNPNGAIIVKGGIAGSVELVADKDFYIPKSFRANNITYRWTTELGADGKNGWQTITLPFGVQSVTSEETPIDWYRGTKNEAEKDFWVREFKQVVGNVVEFADAHDWVANVPYIIAVPGNHWGPQYDLTHKDIQFKASNVLVERTAVSAVVSDGFEFVGLTGGLDSASDLDNVYILNANGSAFVPVESTLITGKHNLAYFTINDRTITPPACLNIGTFDNTDGISTPKLHLTDGQLVDVYAIDGVKVSTVTIKNGTIDLSCLSKGVYIVEGKKVVKK